jgi:hypothetical protein
MEAEMRSPDFLLELDYLMYGTDIGDFYLEEDSWRWMKISSTIYKTPIVERFVDHYESACYSDLELPYIMPILQGDTPDDYVNHLRLYSSRFDSKWIGVGSLKRYSQKPHKVLEILSAIKEADSNLRLHGFGLSKKCLLVPAIRKLIYSADSSAHVFAHGSGKQKYVNQHDPQTALVYAQPIYEAIKYDKVIRQMWTEKFGV